MRVIGRLEELDIWLRKIQFFHKKRKKEDEGWLDLISILLFALLQSSLF